jgi:hypothetical protein
MPLPATDTLLIDIARTIVGAKGRAWSLETAGL